MITSPIACVIANANKLRPLQKGFFLPPALFANAHLLLNKLRFAAELKNKNYRFLHAVSNYAKLSSY